MVEDRQKVITRSESRRYRVAGRLVQSPEQERVKTRRRISRRENKAGALRKTTLADLNIQDELAQRDRKHRDKYTGDIGEDG